MELSTIGASQTMSSREIAELLEARHDSVKRSVERLVENKVIAKTPLVDGIKSANGVTERVYFLDKRSSLIVVAQLSPQFTARIVDRWQELESKQTPVHKIPQTLSEALLLGAELAKKVEEQSTQLAIQAPKVAVYEVLADRKQDVSTTILAKHLSTTAQKLNQFLRDKGVKWLNQDLPKAGYMDWFNVVSDVKNGFEFTQCLVTPLGQLKITELWAS